MAELFDSKTRCVDVFEPSEFKRIGDNPTPHQIACIAEAVERFGGDVLSVLVKSGMYFYGAPCLNCLAYGYHRDAVRPGMCSGCEKWLIPREWSKLRGQRNTYLCRNKHGMAKLAVFEERVQAYLDHKSATEDALLREKVLIESQCFLQPQYDGETCAIGEADPYDTPGVSDYDRGFACDEETWEPESDPAIVPGTPTLQPVTPASSHRDSQAKETATSAIDLYLAAVERSRQGSAVTNVFSTFEENARQAVLDSARRDFVALKQLAAEIGSLFDCTPPPELATREPEARETDACGAHRPLPEPPAVCVDDASIAVSPPSESTGVTAGSLEGPTSVTAGAVSEPTEAVVVGETAATPPPRWWFW